jgi:hypothetical protein
MLQGNLLGFDVWITVRGCRGHLHKEKSEMGVPGREGVQLSKTWVSMKEMATVNV